MIADKILLYFAGGLPLLLILFILYQRAKILVLREVISGTTESNVRLADEVKKANARMQEIEQREANFMNRPVNILVKPEAVQAMAGVIAPIVAEAVVAELKESSELAKRKPN